MSQGNTVCVATRLWATQSGSFNPSMGKQFFSSPNIQAWSGAHPASYSMGTGSFPGVRWSGREVDL